MPALCLPTSRKRAFFLDITCVYVGKDKTTGIWYNYVEPYNEKKPWKIPRLLWEQRESNPRPSACKADALNQLSYAPFRFVCDANIGQIF